ncbi:TVP38/TMEM64 family protein [Metabacillus litoralis]|uniref:TVP38/TMEM64 family membrane protein n=1 Tax=Metabacillus litoralis TaxID=152268 RepID=A0A5C6VVV8_9BACI|nr:MULTISPECIES: TVP38/TMEM64 family protein [Metabacillus]MBM7604153.1 putative membrane protein YdjX (TVP38/TMEM64 family) [Metabacillus crassostreae]TXC89666.1 TVP38/TMEM64 family protein [Metabacillus litoralis]
MNLETLQELFTIDQLMELFETYRSFGPFFAILLPLLEAFLPFLPLVVLIVANVNSFGLWMGFFLSWIGASLGSILVFFIMRKLGQFTIFKKLREKKGIRKLLTWIERRGFSPLFLILCFPFTPSAAINVVAGLSRISYWQFILAVLSGKFVMIFMVSFVGQDLQALITQPIRSIIAGVVIFLLWYIGKKVEHRLNRTVTVKNRDH